MSKSTCSMPNQIYPTLLALICAHPAFVHSLYSSTAFDDHHRTPSSTCRGPRRPLVPTKMPINWDPNAKGAPCWLLGLYHSAISHGAFETLKRQTCGGS